jgi:hypothetical protein
MTPDPPRPPGAPELPDLDVNVPRIAQQSDVPVDTDVNPDAAAPEPPD